MSLLPLRKRFGKSLLALVVAVLGVALVTPAAPAAAARAPKINSEYFGVHHQGLYADGPIGWPQAPVGSVRLWDTGVAWNEIELTPGVFDWTLLDAEVAKARANGASVLLVLGQTPVFHSTNPTQPSTYGLGASAMPDKASWTAYIRAVADRNRTVWGGVADFQVWNEANVVGYWSGTARQMAVLTKWTDDALRAAGSTATLVAPAMVTRLTSQRTWIRDFYKQRVSRKNVSAYVDAVSFQLYPAKNAGPEASMKLLAAVKAILAKNKINKPIWNTEVNYGLVGGPTAGATAKAIPVSRQVSNVLRTFALNAGNRVRRVYWYSWDMQAIANTPMVAADRVTLTSAGRAFLTARSWLLGTRPAGCAKARNGTYTCSFTTSTQTRRVVWNPTRTVRYSVPRGHTKLLTWSSVSGTRLTKKRVRVGLVPVLLTTPR